MGVNGPSDEHARWQRDQDSEEYDGGEQQKTCSCESSDIERIGDDTINPPSVDGEVKLHTTVDVSDAPDDAVQTYERFARIVEDIFELSVEKNIMYGNAMMQQALSRANDPAFDEDEWPYHFLDGVLTRTGDKRARINQALRVDGPLDMKDETSDVRETASYWLWAALAASDGYGDDPSA